MSVRELEKMVSPITNGAKAQNTTPKEPAQSSAIFRSIETDWNKKYNLNFKLHGKNENRGKIEIPLCGRDEFDRIISLFNTELVKNEK
jgi:ParB family chromosome partitioning protein